MHPYHQLLATRITKCAKNKRGLSSYRKDLDESNFVDKIPTQYIKACTNGPTNTAWWQLWKPDFEPIPNPRFDNSQSIKPRNIGNAGVATPWAEVPIFNNTHKILIGTGLSVTTVATVFYLLLNSSILAHSTLGCSAAFFALLSSTLLPLVAVSATALTIGVGIYAAVNYEELIETDSTIQPISP